jgi:uncharacterized protein GlcG (DUF336 family)
MKNYINCSWILRALALTVALLVALAFTSSSVLAHKSRHACKNLPSYAELTAALCNAVTGNDDCSNAPTHGGFSLHMWATVVNRDGVVCAVTHTGDNRGDQWPGSRVISAQKANAANAFSLPGFAISTAQLWEATRDQGSLAELEVSNPVDTGAAYKGPSRKYGTKRDPAVGRKIGGVNIFGGGLALYDGSDIIGALGVSGDTSCEDHSVAWNTRANLSLDNVPAGPATAFSVTADALGDELIFIDVVLNPGFGHQHCFNDGAGAGTIQP